MKSIKVKNCRTCPHILYDDGKGLASAFWRCGGFNIMLIDQETGIHNNLDEIHAQCKLDEYADTACVIHGMTPHDIKELNKKEQIGGLLKLKYQRQDVCLGEPFNIGVKPITMPELYGEPPLKKCIKWWKWWRKQFK